MNERDDIRTCETCHGRYLAPPGAYGRALKACRNCRHADMPPDRPTIYSSWQRPWTR